MESVKYFETIKCEDFEVFNLSFHNKRIANTIGLNIDLCEYIYPPSEQLLRCKVIYDESGILEVDYFPYKKREIKTFKVIFDDEIDYSKKYLDRKKLDDFFSKRENCDDIIIVKNSLVTDTSIANIAIYYEGLWICSNQSLLEGTTKSRLVSEGNLILKDITFDMLKNSSKIALMNAMIGFEIIEDYSFKL